MEDTKFYGSATVGTKGQIVIPQEAREDFDIKEGEKMIVIQIPGGEGLAIMKASVLNAMIRKLQAHVGLFTDPQQNDGDK